MYRVLKNGKTICDKVDLPTLDTKVISCPIAAMVGWMENHVNGEFGLYEIEKTWPTPDGKRAAIFEAEDGVYTFVEF